MSDLDALIAEARRTARAIRPEWVAQFVVNIRTDQPCEKYQEGKA